MRFLTIQLLVVQILVQDHYNQQMYLHYYQRCYEK